ncbi:hypothetical protein GGR16_002066 [Chelatococcus caeni]|uniref:DUF1330 domain-containing protein n=1 Tax=Chelatococcus caeni TaxID=1348468 RepID=A0A840C3N7_9HYPH|nr:hypothetical protein [Chelatococcus caeni]MBB4017037.1 hypothetical protein [Chelatococcus caeni]
MAAQPAASSPAIALCRYSADAPHVRDAILAHAAGLALRGEGGLLFIGRLATGAARPEEVVAVRFATLTAAQAALARWRAGVAADMAVELIALDEASGAEAAMMLFP